MNFLLLNSHEQTIASEIEEKEEFVKKVHPPHSFTHIRIMQISLNALSHYCRLIKAAKVSRFCVCCIVKCFRRRRFRSFVMYQISLINSPMCS